MATSSFVEKIRVNNPKVMVEYVAALEAAEKAPVVASDDGVFFTPESLVKIAGIKKA